MYKILKPCEETYKLAGEAIKNGKVIVVPTDAVYAVVCDALNEEAVKRLREIRQSPNDKPLSVIIDKKDIEKYCEVKNDDFRRIIDILLPGKVSFLMKKTGSEFQYAAPGSDAVCVFWQDNETRGVYEKSRTILAISSANKAGQPEATTLKEAVSYFGDEVDIFIDSGEERGNKGTTQLDIREDNIKVMRESEMFPLNRINSLLKENGITVTV
ncbi:MAG: L-threonylcarbamoyladenylate synthase [Bacillota bacterium]